MKFRSDTMPIFWYCMVTDAPAPCVTRTSADMILAVQDKRVLLTQKQNISYLHHVSVEKL